MATQAKTLQIKQWESDFGRDYTDRNSLEPGALDALYQKNYGLTRSQLNQRFLEGIPVDARILEVGCNTGNQLLVLQQMGFREIHGIEVQGYALERAESRVPGGRLLCASAFNIPYPSGYFDLVFTSGVLIHVAPEDVSRAMVEIHRCAGSYIWGLEYYAPETTEVNYRGHQSLLWKTDFAGLYLKEFKDLELVRLEYLPYLEGTNVDCMFLLRKTGAAH
ncbi:MAG TPA: pseudaminic acid biosynthesis-associated methylase [Terriglobales bacterium]